MGDAWLDKLDEIQALHDEITIDVEVCCAMMSVSTSCGVPDAMGGRLWQEKTRLDRQGHGTDRIATRISRDTSRQTLTDELQPRVFAADC